jgi:hypothetical protein
MLVLLKAAPKMPPVDTKTLLIATSLVTIAIGLIFVAALVDELVIEAWRARVLLGEHSLALDRIGRAAPHEESKHAAKTIDVGEGSEQGAG